MDKEKDNKPFPYLSLCGAIGFAVSLIVLTVLEVMPAPESPLALPRTRVMNVMLCVLLASLSSVVSLITAWCPIILGGDRRPWCWVVPLLLGWILFAQWFDWKSLVPLGP